MRRGGTIAVVESVKAASDIYAPAKGTVVEVNKALESNPALINTDPYGEGWIYRPASRKRGSAQSVEGRRRPTAPRSAEADRPVVAAVCGGKMRLAGRD